MSAPAIALRDVTKRYGSRAALAGVSFEVRPGEAVGYLGPNGAGKSTTMRLLVGAARPDAGTVELCGVPPFEDRTRALARVGALVETPGTAPFLHARDLLWHAATVRDVPVAGRRGTIESLAERVGVKGQLDRPLGSLSTGLLRRVLIAVALVGDPAVLLLDEPTLGLDPAARRALRDLLRAERRSGRTILLSTHLLDDVEAVCDRVLFLRDGRLVGDERVDEGAGHRDRVHARRLAVRLLEPVAEDRLRAAVGAEVDAQALGDGEWFLDFTGDERSQAAIIDRLVAAGLGVVRASTPDSDLARRYLEVVGREEAG